MKFILAASNRYWWPVKVSIPHPTNAGQMLEQTFKMQFEAQPRDEAIKHQTEYNGLETIEQQASHDHEQLRRLCKNWDDVEDEHGKPVPFSEDAFNAAIQHIWFRTGVYRAYAESLNGAPSGLGN